MMADSNRPLVQAAAGSLVAVVLLQYLRVAPIGAVLAFAIYFILWWVCLFVVLPFGVETQNDHGEVVQGTSAGAPLNPRLGRIAALTTILASVTFAVVLLALRFKIVPLE
jgi:predicted secreted protein